MIRRIRLLSAVLALGLAGCASNQAPDPAAGKAVDLPQAGSVPARAAVPPADAVAPAPSANADATPQPAAPIAARELPASYLRFGGACEDQGDIVTIAAVGDIMGHRELQKQAYASRKGFAEIWEGIADLLSIADLTYANLEAPTAQGVARDGTPTTDPGKTMDNDVYSGYARFNIHASILGNLVDAGVDVVSTANNHSLDREAIGIDRTLDALDKAKLPHTGTRRQEHRRDAPWHTVTEAKGLRIAWLACTLHTNFGKDLQDQVLHCFDKKKRVVGIVAELAAKPDIDAVIVTPHWGKEYSPQPSERQIEHAKLWIEAGATAVIGSHPHVVEPWDIVTAADGREALVMYSLGNFFSHQRTLNRRSTVVLYFGLRKTADGVKVVGARYVPLHVRMVGDKQAFFVEAIDRTGGPADARALLVEQMGPYNLMHPDEPLAIAPHCDSRWAFPSAEGVSAWTPPTPAP